MLPNQIIVTGVRELKNDQVNGARVLARTALQKVHEAIEWELGELVKTDDDNYTIRWNSLCMSCYHLSKARPSMGAATTATLLEALDRIFDAWHANKTSEGELPAPRNLARLALEETSKLLKDLDARDDRLVLEFVEYVRREWGRRPGDKHFRILTLSSSSTVFHCLASLVETIATLDPAEKAGCCIDVRILESRPLCEGKSLAAKLLQALSLTKSEGCIKITVAPDSHVCDLSEDVDLVVLGADRISKDGDASNKMGSFPAALCAKQVSPHAKVMVLAETDKIAMPGLMAQHEAEHAPPSQVWGSWKVDPETKILLQRLADADDIFAVKNTVFEWVPARFIDLYVTELGLIDSEQIVRISKKRQELQKRIFTPRIRAAAGID